MLPWVQFVGHPWFPLSPQLILGEDYVTPVLKEQTGRLLEDAYGSGSWLYQLVPAKPGLCQALSCAGHRSRQDPGVGTPWDSCSSSALTSCLICLWGALKVVSAVVNDDVQVSTGVARG